MDTKAHELILKTGVLVAKLGDLLKTEDYAMFQTHKAEVDTLLSEWNGLRDELARNGTDKQKVLAERVVSMPSSFLPLIEAHSSDLKRVSTSPAAGGKRRKMSRKYCKKTPCKKMGFSQKASCRPYKNCFTRRVRQKGY
jgi:hypothetical protein